MFLELKKIGFTTKKYHKDYQVVFFYKNFRLATLLHQLLCG